MRMDDMMEYYLDLLLKEFDDILVDELSNKLPPLIEINHRISFKPKISWIAYKYRLPDAHKKTLEQDVEVKLWSDIYRYISEIPLATSHMIFKKEHGKLRHVQDLRKRNADIESMSWSIFD